MIGVLVVASAAAGLRHRDGSEHPVVREMLKEHVPHHSKWKYEAVHIPPPMPHDVVESGVHLFGKRDSHKPPQNTTYPKNLLYLLKSFSAGLGIPLSYNDVLPTDPPTSFWATQTYLGVGAIDPYGNPMPLDSAIALQERTLTKFGLNLYDGAVWEIALALYDLEELAWVYERNILYTSTTGPMGRDKGAPGGLVDIRADHDDYKYGDAKISGTALKSLPYPGNVTHFEQMPDGSPSKTPVKEGPGAFYYRIIGPKYQLVDPYMGNYANSFKIPYPNNDTTTPWNVYGMIHFNDWKPITGENVWGGILGPINTLFLATDGNLTNTTCGDPYYPIPCDWKTYKSTPPAVQQAITMLPGFLALLSELGSIFHCPWGSKLYPWDPSEGTNVSNENNFSAYASLVMLGKVLKDYVGTSSSDPILQYAITSVDTLTKAMDTWFDTQLFKGDLLPDGSYAVPQGGHIIDGAYLPVPVGGFGGLAVDCQTWGMTVLGAERVDKVYGTRRAFNVWQAAKKWAGYWKKDHSVIAGVGYTVLQTVNGSVMPQGDIWSAEWTFGAINMAQKMSGEYRKMGDADAAASLLADAQSMWNEATKLWNPESRDEGGLMFPDGSFVYANARFFIPWGWYANPISALCSTAWSVMQMQNFNPFELGGGDKPALVPPPHLMNLLYSNDYM